MSISAWPLGLKHIYLRFGLRVMEKDCGTVESTQVLRLISDFATITSASF